MQGVVAANHAFRNAGWRCTERSVAARGLQPVDGMQGGLQLLPKSPVQLREILVAQLRWERYRTSRLLLVHVLAACALLAWVPLPSWSRPALGAAIAAC